MLDFYMAKPVDAVDASAIAIDRRKPTRIRNLASSWPVMAWSLNELSERLGETRLRARPCNSLHEYGFPGPADKYVTIREYFAADAQRATSVIFENDYHTVHSLIRDGYDLPRLLQDVHGSPIFSAGRQHTGVGFHRHNESWLAQVRGRKMWLLLPAGSPRPEALPPWWYLRKRPSGMRVYILEPGEIFFIPNMWWHATWNLDEITWALGWEGGASSSWPEPMHAIADGNLSKLVRWGLRSSERVTPQMAELAARGGHVSVLRWLLKEGAHARMEQHSTALAMAASRGGHVSILELLSMWGIPVLPPHNSVQGTSALHEAARCGQPCAVSWLLHNSATPHMRNAAGSQAIHLAAFHGHPLIVKALLCASAAAESLDARGSAPLLHASFNGHTAVAELLLAARASVEASDALKMTPLHHAALRGHATLAALLLVSQGDVGALDHESRTPLHLSAHGYQDADDPLGGIRSAPDANMAVVEALLAARAATITADRHGLYPYQYAEARGHLRVAELLLTFRDGESVADGGTGHRSCAVNRASSWPHQQSTFLAVD